MVREESGHLWEKFHSSMLVYLLLPIDTAIDSWENICGRITTTKLQMFFQLKVFLVQY